MNKQSLTQLALAGLMAGGMMLTGCEKNSTAPKDETVKTGISAASTLAAFQAECAKIKGTFAAHDCSGMNSCKGHSFQVDMPVVSHDCKGMSSCQGGSCIEG